MRRSACTNWLAATWNVLGKARLALRYRAPDVEAALSRVPNLLRTDAGLFYERVHWRLNNGKPELALELARNAANSLRAPQSRSVISGGIIRKALRAWRWKRGLQNRLSVAATHNYQLPDEAAPYAEAEWLAGWVALRFLNQPANRISAFHPPVSCRDFADEPQPWRLLGGPRRRGQRRQQGRKISGMARRRVTRSASMVSLPPNGMAEP